MGIKTKDTSPIGVLLITIVTLIVTIIITMLLTVKCKGNNTESKIETKTIYKTQIDTVYQKVDSKTTLYAKEYVYIKDTIITQQKSLKQEFNIKDSILDLRIFTFADDTVKQIGIDYSFKQPTITKTDSIIINNTITITNKEDKIKFDKLKAKQFPRILSSFLAGNLFSFILVKYVFAK